MQPASFRVLCFIGFQNLQNIYSKRPWHPPPSAPLLASAIGRACGHEPRLWNPRKHTTSKGWLVEKGVRLYATHSVSRTLSHHATHSMHQRGMAWVRLHATHSISRISLAPTIPDRISRMSLASLSRRSQVVESDDAKGPQHEGGLPAALGAHPVRRASACAGGRAAFFWGWFGGAEVLLSCALDSFLGWSGLFYSFFCFVFFSELFLFVCLFVCLLVCFGWFVRSFVSLPACLPAGWLAGWLARLLACVLFVFQEILQDILSSLYTGLLSAHPHIFPGSGMNASRRWLYTSAGGGARRDWAEGFLQGSNLRRGIPPLGWSWLQKGIKGPFPEMAGFLLVSLGKYIYIYICIVYIHSNIAHIYIYRVRYRAHIYIYSSSSWKSGFLFYKWIASPSPRPHHPKYQLPPSLVGGVV